MRGALNAMLRWWKESNGNGQTVDSNSHAMNERVAPAPRPLAPPEPPWLAQLDREGIPRSLNYPTTTLGRIVDQAADRFGALPALIYNNRRISYDELLSRSNHMAGGLSRLGVCKCQHAQLDLPNRRYSVVNFIA